jgi:hypothetical protein
MCIERRKFSWPFPKYLEHAIMQLKWSQKEEFLMFRGEKYIHLPDDCSFICITTEDNWIDELHKCSCWRDIRLYFKMFLLQLYIIHGYKNRTNIY